jgi:hypothetical protein
MLLIRGGGDPGWEASLRLGGLGFPAFCLVEVPLEVGSQLYAKLQSTW